MIFETNIVYYIFIQNINQTLITNKINEKNMRTKHKLLSVKSKIKMN